MSRRRVALLCLLAALLLADGERARGAGRGSARGETPASAPPRWPPALARANRELAPAEVERIASAVVRYSRKYAIDPVLVTAVLLVESSARPWARSPKGAIGLMQIMPHVIVPSMARGQPRDHREQHRGRLLHARRQHPPARRGGRDLRLLLGLRHPRPRLPGAGARGARGGAPAGRVLSAATIPAAPAGRAPGERAADPPGRVRARDAAAGRTLFRRSWLPAAPRARAAAVHGFAEHSGRYEHVGAWFAARGCAVHAYDHQGHGRSDGRARPRAALRRLPRRPRARCSPPSAPSTRRSAPSSSATAWAGSIVTAFAVRARAGGRGRGHLGRRCSALSREPLARAHARGARAAAPGAAARASAAGSIPRGSRAIPRWCARYLEDPLVFRSMTTSLAAELMGAVERTARSAAQVRVPLLMLHGGGGSDLSRRRARAASSRASRWSRAGSQTYPGLRHEIFNEPEQRARLRGRAGWLRRAIAEGVTRVGGELSHLDAQGRARMVDVSEKPVTRRACVARGAGADGRRRRSRGSRPARCPRATCSRPRGSPAIQAAKRTDEWIPLCHTPAPRRGRGRAGARTRRARASGSRRGSRVHARTGVEMEALVAVAAAGLTIYDMCKAIDRGIARRGRASGAQERGQERRLDSLRARIRRRSAAGPSSAPR